MSDNVKQDRTEIGHVIQFQIELLFPFLLTLSSNVNYKASPTISCVLIISAILCEDNNLNVFFFLE